MHIETHDGVAAPDPWLTLQQAADEVRAHPASLRRAIVARRLRAARIGGVPGGAIRIRRTWLIDWLERNAEPVELAPRIPVRTKPRARR